MLGEGFDLEGTIEFRRAAFVFNGTITFGDDEAVASGPAATLGIVYRF